VVKAPTIGECRIGHDPNDMSQGLKYILVTIARHSVEPHLPTYFQYIYANVNHAYTFVTKDKHSTNQDDGCFSCGKDYVTFLPGCACNKQGGVDFVSILTRDF
jgi:hypothetical protein